ncbi:Hpt domain-containing protein [Devosia beringensis]|uniref:Hpt domain-containing protein n=1 Tax=Devosia beringensis TaxID=2657486 RepID=UPI00186B724B|nr:Hpt domain-containing protein [Devosia beringensis]
MAQTSAAVDQTESRAPTRPERPIDLVHLAKQCMGDARLEQEILRLYDTTLKTYFGRLQLAASYDDLTLNIHSIKGASDGVGAFAIANLARAAETELQAGRPLAPERIDDLGLAVEEARAFIARLLDNAPA